MPPVDRRILIVDLAYLGDTLMTSPVIANLRRNHPWAVIDFLVSRASAIVVQYNEELNEVITVDKAAFRGAGGLGVMTRLAGRLREKRYDTAFVVHRSLRAALLCAMAGIPKRVGLATQGRGGLLTHPVLLDESKHRTDNALALLEAVGEPVTTRTLAFKPGPAAAIRAEGALDYHGWDRSRPLIALAPGGAWITKRWPPERFGALARALAQRGHQVVLVGGPGEEPIGKAIAEAAQVPVLDLIGQTDFDHLYEVFRRCAGVVSNDSGPMHLAAAAGVPVVGIFGPTDPVRCGPVTEHAATIAGEVPCLACYLKTCDHHSCMALLSPRAVLAELEALLAAKAEPATVEFEIG